MDTSLRGMVGSSPLVIFSRSNCCMSHTVVTLISNFGANPTVYELDQIQNGQQIERALQQLGYRNVPVVFIGQQLIGGEQQVMSLHLRKELVPLLKRAGALWL
ncbi:Thioredoxin superfamily protein [Tripterygium wilfordii]|uniref:Thioredoxin superfamily protein n=1 Tax=Tripterygium wilfordii TaxID=458696 RepID=A0A7J7CC17_TRIWF|nr:monothiol glutaredoxin-S5-like [Tripterygium wilfordii]KAF5731475.1 Thioredoxin superfamily protein [Tripterygium wilfordii]